MAWRTVTVARISAAASASMTALRNVAERFSQRWIEVRSMPAASNAAVRVAPALSASRMTLSRPGVNLLGLAIAQPRGEAHARQPLQRDGDVLGLNLHAVAGAASLLGRHHRRPRAHERLIDVALMVADRPGHTLQRLLCGVTALDVLVQRDLPDRRGIVVTDPMSGAPLLHAIPTGLMLVGVMASADREVWLPPDDLIADLVAGLLERIPRENHVVAARRPRIGHVAGEQPPRLGPVDPIVVGHLAYAAARRVG